MPYLQHRYALALEIADDIIVVIDNDKRRCIDHEDLFDRIKKIQEIHPQAVFFEMGKHAHTMISFALQCIMDQFKIAFQLSAF